MKKSKLMTMSLMALLAVVGCTKSNNKTTSETSSAAVSVASGDDTPIADSPKISLDGDEDDIYDGVFGDFNTLYTSATDITDNSERYVAFAKAEAALLDSAAFLPNTTNGGSYVLSHAAFRSIPYVQFGYDSDRLKSVVIASDFVSKAERTEMEALWNDAKKNGTEYNPKAYLESKGHTLNKTYNSTFSAIPATLDIQTTSLQSDTEYIVQGLDGLVEYSNTGELKPAIAESWSYDDATLTWTFKLRNDVNWYKSDGTVYAKVTASDFVSGFQHMLDAQSSLSDLIKGIVKGANKYTKDASTLGIKAVDDTTLTITLEKEVPYFLTMLTYSPFAPLNADFFLSQGGQFGKTNFNKAKEQSTYTYGKKGHPESILYNGAFRCVQMDDTSVIKYVANDNYYDAANRNVDTLMYTYNDGSNTVQYYDDVKAHKYVGVGLNQDLIKLAKQDNLFDEYAYVSSTGSTTYFLAYNLNRQCYDTSGKDLDSKKTDEQKNQTRTAMVNKNFRKAMSYAVDKSSWNAITSGDDLKDASLRNIYTSPDFVSLENDVTVDGHTFTKGTKYGDLVQYYADEMGLQVNCADATNGWYHPELAKKYMAKAVEELTAEDPSFFSTPVNIEIINYSSSQDAVNQCQAYKKIIEETLGSDKINITILNTTQVSDYYAASYYCNYGSEVCYDTYWGSGWGPDYGDPSTYLNTFLEDGQGYMTKTVGLY